MDVAILTVGDEVFAGDIENTNATWLAGRLTAAGATVARILTVPDDRAVIREAVDGWRDAFDAVIVTGDLGGTHDDVTVDAWAALPEGGRPLVNPEGLCPGCVVDNVYAFPGVPGELRALFELVGGEFGGEAVSTTLYTPQPEGSMVEALAGVRDRFDVTVGSYPRTGDRNRLIRVIVTVHRWIAETGGRSTGTDLQ
jgi:molybdenum cofactor synthesis domain-containing protein